MDKNLKITLKLSVIGRMQVCESLCHTELLSILLQSMECYFMSVDGNTQQHHFHTVIELNYFSIYTEPFRTCADNLLYTEKCMITQQFI